MQRRKSYGVGQVLVGVSALSQGDAAYWQQHSPTSGTACRQRLGPPIVCLKLSTTANILHNTLMSGFSGNSVLNILLLDGYQQMCANWCIMHQIVYMIFFYVLAKILGFYVCFYACLSLFCSAVWFTWFRVVLNADDPIYFGDTGFAWAPGMCTGVSSEYQVCQRPTEFMNNNFLSYSPCAQYQSDGCPSG